MGSNFELSNNVLFGVKYFQKEEKGEGGGVGGRRSGPPGGLRYL